MRQAIRQFNYVMAEVRIFIESLESEIFQSRDFSSVLRRMVRSMSTSSTTKCRVLLDAETAHCISTEQALHFLNVVKEALSNSLRHGRATRVTVSFKTQTNGLRLSITDNGVGFHPEHTRGTGRGLTNMEARVRRLGGRFTVRSKPQGTRILVDVPSAN